jgi:hypothetical protein
MAPEGFVEYFLATSSAGGAFIGLLFVAISIGPERTFRALNRMGPPQQQLAEAALLTLTNGFVVSCIALLPDINVGWVALGFGVWGVAAAVLLGRRFARFHQHGARRRLSLPHQLRVTSLSLIAIVVFTIESLFGWRLILQPGSVSAFHGLALAILAIFALAILRAWTLLGDPQYGWSGWLNPLRDLPARGENAEPPDASS